MNITKEEFIATMRLKIYHRKRLEELTSPPKKITLPKVIIKKEDDLKFLKKDENNKID
jgi:hypothetical protein